MPPRKKEEHSIGRMSATDIRNMINKKTGQETAYNLKEDDSPTRIDDWISTGSRWLDCIILQGSHTNGKPGGIPVGRVTEIAGLESSGKSFMCVLLAANAQKKGMTVVYFDSESSIDPIFLENAGCNANDLIYVQATSVEFVLEQIEALLSQSSNQFLFIWDSVAMTPCEADIQGGFDPMSSIALKPRILAKGVNKLQIPLNNHRSTLVYTNQLKTNITRIAAEALMEPFVTPGGKSLIYSASLRIWLTSRKGKASLIRDANDFIIGNEVKVKIKKSKFGTQHRECAFRILWGGHNVRIQDEESWFEAIRTSPSLQQKGAWYTLNVDGKEEKFQQAQWLHRLEDSKFKNRVLELMDEELIHKFENKLGNAKEFYNIDGIEDEEPIFEEV